jgi:hypothetical protein
MIITLTIHGNSEELADVVAEQVKNWILSNVETSSSHKAIGVMQIDDYFEVGKPMIKGFELNTIHHESENDSQSEDRD